MELPGTRAQILHHRIPSLKGEEVHVVELRPPRAGEFPALISIHGTGGPGYGDRRWRLRLGRKAVAEGFRFFIFDSRGTGYSDGDFENWTVSGFVEDASTVLEWVRKQPGVDSTRIGLFGFSLGSAVAVLVASRSQRWIKAIIVYTLPCDMDRGFLWYFERFVPGSLDRFYSNGRAWLPPLGEYLNRTFLDDLAKHDVKQRIATLQTPMLLIQPDKDDQVPEWVSRQAYVLKPRPKTFLKIKGTHTMHSGFDNAGHPTGWNNKQERQVIDTSLRWFKRNL